MGGGAHACFSYLGHCLGGTWFILFGNHHHPIPARVLAPARPILLLHFLIRFPIPYCLCCHWIPCQTCLTVLTLPRVPIRAPAPARARPIHQRFLNGFPIPCCPWIPCQTCLTVLTLPRVPIRAPARDRARPIHRRLLKRFLIRFPPWIPYCCPCQTCRSSPSLPQVSTAILRPKLPPLFPLPNDLRAVCHEPVRDRTKHGIG